MQLIGAPLRLRSLVVLVAALGADPYVVVDFTIDAGGGRSGGDGFVLDGTIGQPDADPLQPSAGGGFEVVGGFARTEPAVVTDAVFKDGFE